jgi:putative membrane protein
VSHAAIPVGVPWERNRLLRWLTGIYAVVWAVAAVAPLDRQTWLLENGLVFVLVGVLAVTHRRFAFSNVSIVLIFAFLALHAVGAHYTYSKVPVGDWVQSALDLSRNHYDRFVHFSFGLLLGYPLRELGLRVAHAHGIFSYAGPPVVVLALGAVYEIIESWAARITDPSVGLAYVGAQGDIWDGQKDMSLAFAGALIAMALTSLVRRRTGHEPYLLPIAG